MAGNTPSFNNAVGPNVRGGIQAGRSLLVGLLVVTAAAAAQTATQLCAADFGYQPALGPSLGGVYPPWAIVGWYTRWQSVYPTAFSAAFSGGQFALLGGLLVIALVKSAGSKANPYLHGSARWAGRSDIEAAGLLPTRGGRYRRRKRPAVDDGVYVGAWADARGRTHYLRHSGPEHVLCYAPTRSGKGVGLVVPTLLSWRHSAFVTDLKGELWELTAGWRRAAVGADNRVLRFEPSAMNGSACWNCLEEIRLGTEAEVGDVQNIATLLVDPDGKGLQTHWQKTARALFVGVILHALYEGRASGVTPNLSTVDRMLSDPRTPVGELWQQMLVNDHLEGTDGLRAPHPIVAAAARDMIDRPDDEAGSVLSTVKSYLDLYRDPVVSKNTAASDFRIRDLMHGAAPMTLYLVTQPSDKDRMRPLVRILVNMTIRLLADQIGFDKGRPRPLYKHRLLLMLDEFTSMKRLSILQEALAYIAGYGIKAYLICQDTVQIKSESDGYGRDETITSNCHVQVAFPPNKLETAEHLSRLTGQTSVAHEQVTSSGGLFSKKSKTKQWVQRPLLTPDECLRLPGPQKDAQGQITRPGDMLLFSAGAPAIYGKQPLYFQDAVFSARASVAPPVRPSSRTPS